MRGVLGCSDDGSVALGFLPVYFRGDGDLYEDVALLLFCVRPVPLAFLVVEGVNFGVVWTPVTWVGDSTLNSSSS